MSVHERPRTQLNRALILCASASAVIYLLVFSLPFPLSRYYNTIPPVDYAKLTQYAVSGFLAYVIGLLLLYGLYVAALRLVWPGKSAEANRPGAGFILLIGAGLGATLLLAYPTGAIDVLVYAVYTRGWAVHGLNPLATAPAQFPASDPWVGLTAEWSTAASPYGMMWQVLALAPYVIGGGNFLVQVIGLKGLVVLAYLGSAALIYVMLKRQQPAWAAAGTIAFAWNPLVLLEIAQNGHNDIVMMFFLLAAVWALQRSLPWHPHPASRTGRERDTAKSKNTGRWLYPLLVCLFLALSILTKFITVITAPFFLLALASRGSRWSARLARLIGFSALLGGLVIAGTWPLWPGWDQWAVVEGADAAGRSILALAVLSVRNWVGLNTAFDAANVVLRGVFVLTYIYELWRTFRASWRSTPDTMSAVDQQAVASAALVLFWLLLLVMPVFHAWYIVWSLPLAVLLLPATRLFKALIVFSLSALLAVPYFETIRVWYPELLRNPLLGHVIGVALLAVPPIVVLAWPVRESRQQHL
jgi:hypothetical protein